MKRSIWISILILIMPLLLSAQLSEMQIVGHPEPLSDVIVARRDINGNFCAGIKIISEMDGFSYDSYNGIVGKIEDKPGEDLVYVSANERVLMVYHSGYEPLKIILQETGIRLKPRTVWQIKISGEARQLPVTFVVTPSDAKIAADGQNVPEGGSIRLGTGRHFVTVNKDGFETIQDSIVVSEDQTVFRYTLKKKEKAILVVESEPEGAEVYLNGTLYGTTHYQGMLESGTYTLELKKDLYEPYQKQIYIKSGQTNTERAALLSSFGYIDITSNPSEANVIIDKKPVGNTPVQSIRLTSGTHFVNVEKLLYYAHEETVEVEKGRTFSMNVTLKPAFGSLVVRTDRPGMDVTLDGRVMGKTPYTNEQIASGVYELRITGDMMREIARSITIRDGETTEITESMPVNFGTLKIEASPETEVYIDDRSAGKGSMIRELKAGSYRVEGHRLKHNPDKKQVLLIVGKETEVTLAPEPRYGKLSVMVSPSEARDAEIFINEKSYGHAPKIISDLLEGTYAVHLQKKGYLPCRDEVNIQYQKDHSFEPVMVTYAGSRKAVRDKWKRWGHTTLIGTALFLGGGLGCDFLANQSFDKYKESATVSDVENYRKKTDDYSDYRNISYGVGAALTLWTVINYTKMASVKVNEPGISMDVDVGVNRVGLVMRF